MKKIIFIKMLLLLLASAQIYPLLSDETGKYFSKKKYIPKPLPKFQSTKEKLPSPVFEENPMLVNLYWEAWEIAFKNFHEPDSGSGFVSQFIDPAFNDNIFLWDCSFMTMFCNYGNHNIPGIETLDNFYCKQHEDGEICREIKRTTGKDYVSWQNKNKEEFYSVYSGFTEGKSGKTTIKYIGREAPSIKSYVTLDALDHPILAWAELESYRITGNKERLKKVFDPLKKYYEALNIFIKQGNGLYITDWASMDNSPRNSCLTNGGCGVDISCEMAMFASNLSEIASIIGNVSASEQYSHESKTIKQRINQLMWNDHSKFYFDVDINNNQCDRKTIAGFWSLISCVASTDQARILVDELNNPVTFKRLHRVPTLSASDKDYNHLGGYWKGSVWAPTNTMILRGLEKYGYDSVAYNIAMNHLNNMGAVFKNTGTIFENYAPDSISQGDDAKDNFVGWSGIGPILYLIEYAIGVKADAPSNTIIWNIHSADKNGIENFWFNNKTVSLIAEKAEPGNARTVTIKFSGKPFTLVIKYHGETYKAKVTKNLKLTIG
jgi:hypothetical protein